MIFPKLPEGYRPCNYTKGDIVRPGSLFWYTLKQEWTPSSYVGKLCDPSCFYCEPRVMRWYDLSKGEYPTDFDGDETGSVLFRQCFISRPARHYVTYVNNISEGFWHPLAKFPEQDPEELAAINLLKSLGYSVQKD